MARARTTPEEDDSVVVKPRARRPRKVVSDDEIEVAAPRRRRATATPIAVEEVSPVRKAPTPLRAHRTNQVRSMKAFMVVGSICFVLATSGVLIGFLDDGPIDVVAVVNDRNEKINRGEVRDEKTGEALTQTISVQNTDTRPNGGLQVADPSAVPTPVPAVTEVATTTDATASTTDAVDPDAETSSPAEGAAVPETAPELPAA